MFRRAAVLQKASAQRAKEPHANASVVYQKWRQNDPGGSMSGRIDGLLYFGDDLRDFGTEIASRLLYYRESNRENRISYLFSPLAGGSLWFGRHIGRVENVGRVTKREGGERGENVPSLPLLHSIVFLYWGSVLFYILYCLQSSGSARGSSGIPIYPIFSP